MKEEKDHSPRMLDQHPVLYLPKKKREALEPQLCWDSGSITQTTLTCHRLEREESCAQITLSQKQAN